MAERIVVTELKCSDKTAPRVGYVYSGPKAGWLCYRHHGNWLSLAKIDISALEFIASRNLMPEYLRAIGLTP